MMGEKEKGRSIKASVVVQRYLSQEKNVVYVAKGDCRGHLAESW